MNADSHCHHTVAPPSAALSSSLSLLGLLIQSEVSKHDVFAGDAAKLCVVEMKLQLCDLFRCVKNSALQPYKCETSEKMHLLTKHNREIISVMRVHLPFLLKLIINC